MKKLFSILMVACLVLILFGFAVPVHASSAPIYGDANGDHSVNMDDVTKIYREILGMDSLTPGADANVNGVVSIGDVTVVERMTLGLNPIYGDADGNLTVNQADITKVQRIILGLDPPTLGADANRSGSVTIADITTIELMIN